MPTDNNDKPKKPKKATKLRRVKDSIKDVKSYLESLRQSGGRV